MNMGCTVQDVFLRFYSSYEKKHPLTSIQKKTAYSIINCKTGGLGVNFSVCEDCGSIIVHNNSCRNRCCPMCQQLPKEKWIDARKEDVLDAPYFHVVFTLPSELNSVIYSNQKSLYGLLFRAAADTLKELAAEKKYLGAETGSICILHTWGSEMNFHPHLHTILLGGGLNRNNRWVDNGKEFFLPIRVISRTFRGKYLAGVKQLWKDGRLEFHGTAKKYRNHYEFQSLIDQCYAKEWVPYCKKAFNGARSVIEYLGKYTHRIAISNHRIKRMDETTVTFSVKDYRQEGKWKELTVSGEEFIRRFLMHVPPKGFVRIRHYALLSTRKKGEKIFLCRNLLGCRKYIAKLKGLNSADIIRILYGVDVCRCSACGGHVVPVPAGHVYDTLNLPKKSVRIP